MLISCWSTKGGAGTTVTAAALALVLARDAGRALLVDLCGDQPTALGLVEHGAPTAAPGVADWLAAAGNVPPDGLARLEEPAGPGLTLVRRGAGPLDGTGADLLAAVLTADDRPVVADCGRVDGPAGDGTAPVAAALAASAGRSLLVLRPCFLALRRALGAPIRPSGVVLLAEEGRALGVDDVEAALGVPVVARVRVTDQVARAVDAGLLAARLPRTLARDLRHAA